MAELMLRVGSCSAQGIRANNEDNFAVDLDSHLFVVADGMGGQERGELASGMAVDIIPRVVKERLAANTPAEEALREAMFQAHQAIVAAGKNQPEGRRMGTTAVCALKCKNQVYIGNLGDSRAYLVREGKVERLTIDHSVAYALFLNGVLTEEEARHSPYNNVLHKFLGCASMQDKAEIKPFVPQAGDRLVLGSDGLTNYMEDKDLIEGAKNYRDPNTWASALVNLALDRGTRDNVTCVVVAFDG